MKAVFCYYSTQRPIGPGTVPSTVQYPPLEVINYDQRIPVENGTMLAWGEIHYAFPLSDKQISDYELKPAPNNPPSKKQHKEKTPKPECR